MAALTDTESASRYAFSMGASASVPARLTKEESMELCGADDWPGGAAFDELASEEVRGRGRGQGRG